MISTSATTQIQSVIPTETSIPTDSSIRMPSISFTLSTNEADRSTSMSPITASPTSSIVIQTTISPSLVLTASEPSVVIVTSFVSQSQSNGGGESSVATTPPVIGPDRNRGPSNAGLIVGLVFLFLILIIVASIVIVLLVIIILRKKKEKKIKSKTTII